MPKNLHPAFKSLIREPLKGQLKSKQDHQTLQVFLKVLRKSGGWRGWTAKTEEGATAACPLASQVVSSLNLSVLLLHYGIVTRGPVCWPNTINKVSAAHQYCYLHRVLICSPYNHKMLIAPINSQSVCALVWPPWALKVSVKMNCSLIPLQEKIFSQDNTVCYSEIKRPYHPLSFLSFPVSCS